MADPDPPQRSGSDALPEGTVTVLFSDVEGSTDLRTREGDDVAQEVLRTHERMLREQIDRHGGREVVFMGDGFMVAFASARKAIECAVGIQRTFEEHNAGEPDHPIRVRIGLNTGEVLRESGTLYGTAVNAAARISAKAKGGQILVSQVTKELTTGVRDFTFTDRGMFSLKGFPTQWRLYEVGWRTEAARETPTPVSQAPSGYEESYPRPELGPLVGRAEERAVIEQDLDLVRTARRIRVIGIEGEAGIGKTRLVESAIAAAAARGFGTVMVGGDEELRGPFFLLRTLLTSASIESLADEARARDALQAARDVIWGRSDAGSGLSTSDHMLRVYDVTTVALRTIAEARPLALLFDDLQWVDEDSIKLIRYLVRTSSATPVFIMLAHRPDAGGPVGPASALIADLERMRLARRMRLERLSRAETGELLEHLLGIPVSPHCAALLHERGEGVPFFIVEFAEAFRGEGLFQQVGGVAEVSETARSTVAPSVQILVERRLAQLSPEVRDTLAGAAVIGRRFRLSELAAVAEATPGGDDRQRAAAELLSHAVEANLIAPLPEGSTYDFSFTHDEIRNALVESLGRVRRRAVHSAIAHMMEAAPGDHRNLSALAFHWLEAGEQEAGVRYSIETARAAMAAFAPEEALRAVDAARPAARSPKERAELLCLRDEALDALGRPEERLATLAEMSAFAQALGDDALEFEVTLRRASAARQAGDHDQAAELAAAASEQAAERSDPRGELRACLELGQARLHSALGESYSPPTAEVDLEGAARAYERAHELAAALGDEATLAAVRREQGVIELGRVRAVAWEMIEQAPDILKDPSVDPRTIPVIGEGFERARAILGEAIELFERLGDQRGLMSTLIAMAYANILGDTPHGHAGRVEQIRRLRRNLRRLTSDAERAESDAYMLYSIHVYARGHGPPDLAVARGIEAYEAARAIGHGGLEFLAAGGVVLAHAALGSTEEAERWLDRAGTAALASQAALPERQLETWRGLVRSASDPAAALRHLERALAIATERGSPAGRCELLALVALEAARHGADRDDEALRSHAEHAAEEALRMTAALPPSDAPWTAQAHAALGQVAAARGLPDLAVEHGLEAVAEMRRTRQFFAFLYPETRLLAARALDGFEDPRSAEFRTVTRIDLQRAADETRDDAIRARWLRTPVMRELIALTGGSDAVRIEASGAAVPAALSSDQVDILRRVMSGETNRDIARALGREVAEISDEVSRLFAALGASSRSEATVAALQGGIV